MFCNECGSQLNQGDKFCKNCGEEQFSIIISEENKYHDNDISDMECENELIPNDDSSIIILKKESLLKKIAKGVSTGGLVAGSGFIYISFLILRFVFVALAGLSMIGSAFSLFSEGSIIWGIIVLFIGTPLIIGITSYFFIYTFILAIIALVIWGITHIFGFDVSFVNVWVGTRVIIGIFLLGLISYFLISSFIEAVKKKDILSFLKEWWFFILLLFFIIWLFY